MFYSKRIQLNTNHVNDNDIQLLLEMMYHAGKVWNEGLYLLKEKKKRPNYRELYHTLVKDEENKSQHIRYLHSRSAQILLDQLCIAYRNFLNFYQNPSKYRNKGITKVNPPAYTNKRRPLRTIIWGKMGIYINGSRLRLSLSNQIKKQRKKKFIEIDTGIDLSKYNIVNVQIVPYQAYNKVTLFLNIIYEANNNIEIEPSRSRTMAIDYGSSNFATIVIDSLPESIIIDGRGIKSLLRKYLRLEAKLRSHLDRDKNSGRTAPTKTLECRLHRIRCKIVNLLRDYAHKVSSMIAKIAIANNVDRIVIGDVQDSKNHTSKLSSVASQMWHLLPHGKVTKYLKYKLEKYNIKVDLVDESYTSVTDSCDPNTRVTKDTIGNGRRIKRGLFLSSVKGIINADVNGARNILRKVLEKWDDSVTGLGRIIKIRVYEFTRKVSPNPAIAG